MAAAAEERSNHPLAHAILDYAREAGIAWTAAEDVQLLPGRGLTARVDGHDCMLGNDALFSEFFVPLPKDVSDGRARGYPAVDGRRQHSGGILRCT